MLDLTEKWKKQETELLESINGSIKYYTERARTARICYRVIGVVVLICVVIAPVAVVSGGAETGGSVNVGLSVFGIKPLVATQIAVATTLIVAFAEGLQRTFQFQQRWIACIQAREALWRLKDTYADEQVPNAIGSNEWIDRFSDLRKKEQEIRIQEETGFFALLKTANERSQPPVTKNE